MEKLNRGYALMRALDGNSKSPNSLKAKARVSFPLPLLSYLTMRGTREEKTVGVLSLKGFGRRPVDCYIVEHVPTRPRIKSAFVVLFT